MLLQGRCRDFSLLIVVDKGESDDVQQPAVSVADLECHD